MSLFLVEVQTLLSFSLEWKIWKDATVIHFQVLTQHSPVETEENHEPLRVRCMLYTSFMFYRAKRL
jgi:hypothetical protein